MSARRFLDTNVLLYSISRANDEARKRERAIALLEQEDCGLSVQVLQEFYVQATRATRADALPHDLAAGLIRAWLRLPHPGQHRRGHAGRAGDPRRAWFRISGQREHRSRARARPPRTL